MRDGEKFRLGDLCSIIKGETPIKQAVPGPYPLVVTAAERASHEAYQFDCKAVIVPLVSSTGHGHASIKRINYQEGKFALGSILCAVIPKDEQRLNPKFLHVYFSYFKDQLIVPLMKGSANVSLSMGALADLKIIVPPIAVQQRVIDLAENDELMKPLELEITHQQFLLTKLKQAILQEAIQGKLTADWRAANPDTEPASELLKRIQTEKAKLIATKKLKKEKPLPPIKPEEMPFEIPNGWEWCLLVSVMILRDGERIPISKSERERRGKGYSYYGASGVIDEIDGFTHDGSFLLVGEDGSNLRLRSTPVAFAASGKIWVNNHAHVLQFIEPSLQEMVSYRINGMDISPFVTGGFQPKLSQEKMNRIPIPLPPLAEQAAIVERVEALMETCRELETEIESSRTHADQLLQAVLKEAFQNA